jgi:REP element-mobilizing transposase RayT
MTYARKTLISLRETPYYHVVARCVRRAWLWGFDEYAGRDYSHRKAWVLERLQQLAAVFTIDVCAYAVMSNHYHLVLRVAAERGKGLSEHEVIERWTRLFARPPLVERYQQGACDPTERQTALRIITEWRSRLSDVSWYMRCLNEHLARRANQEDGCAGRFWEGRFKSQALLDEAGLLTAMAYVDLNPIRAAIAATPEESEFTSVYARIQQLQVQRREAGAPLDTSPPQVPLLAFSDESAEPTTAIPFKLADYLALLDWTGRARAPGKRGSIDEALPSIVKRLNIDARAWEQAMRPAGNVFGRALGRLDHLQLLPRRWVSHGSEGCVRRSGCIRCANPSFALGRTGVTPTQPILFRVLRRATRPFRSRQGARSGIAR